MDEKAMQTVQRWTVWCGPVWAVTYIWLFIVMGHFYPPPGLQLTGEELIATYYLPYGKDILWGMSAASSIGVLWLPWSCLMAVQMWRRERVPLLTLLQLTGGTLTAWVCVMCPAIFAVSAHYAMTGGSPEIVKALYMVGWYIYDLTYAITCVQVAGCAGFAFLDKKTPALFPRWAGWVATVTGGIWLGLTLLPFAPVGSWFAVDGVWNFWHVFVSWLVWFSVYTYYMFKEVARVRISPAPGLGEAVGLGYAE